MTECDLVHTSVHENPSDFPRFAGLITGMSTRRKDQGLGRTAAGGSGGSFASTVHTAPASPPVSPHVEAIRDRRSKYEDALNALKQGHLDLVLEEATAHITHAHPNARTLTLRRDPSEGSMWMESVTDADGAQIELTSSAESAVETLVAFDLDDDAIDWDWNEEEQAGEAIFDLADYVDHLAEVPKQIPYINVEEISESDFARVWRHAYHQLNAGGYVYTRADFEDMITADYDFTEDLTPEQLSALSEAASKGYANDEPSDAESDENYDRRDTAIRQAAGQLGLTLDED